MKMRTITKEKSSMRKRIRTLTTRGQAGLGRELRKCLAFTVSLGMVLLPSQAVLANPQGEHVVRGDVSFSRDGALTQIEASHNSIIEYQSFDIQQHETVQFIQPGAQARVLNRVLGVDPSQIHGALLANGQVYIVNQAGIYFGGTAVVDVGGLYAVAGALTNADFR